MNDAVCPRCGHRNKFRQGRLPNTCVCMVCESQLDWRNIPGCGPDCRPVSDAQPAAPAPPPAASPGPEPGTPAPPSEPAVAPVLDRASPEPPAAAVEMPTRPDEEER